jgi:hypothetical protein
MCHPVPAVGGTSLRRFGTNAPGLRLSGDDRPFSASTAGATLSVGALGGVPMAQRDQWEDVFRRPVVRCGSCGTKQAVRPDAASPTCAFCGEPLPAMPFVQKQRPEPPPIGWATGCLIAVAVAITCLIIVGVVLSIGLGNLDLQHNAP